MTTWRAGRTAFFGWALAGQFLAVALIACGAGHRGRADHEPLSLVKLESLCHLPAPCGISLPCAGRVVTLQAFVERHGIMDRRKTPRVPVEKFTVSDHCGRSVEVWVQGRDNQSIFEKLARRPNDRIRVTGRLEPFNMPIAGGCAQGIKVVVDDAKQIEFE